MRFTVGLLVFLAAVLPGAAMAGSMTTPPSPSERLAQSEQVDQHDDTRVDVQVVVLAVAGGVVAVLGPVLYVLRRRLGLVPPPPELGGDAHH
jgi:hypothetical protein